MKHLNTGLHYPIELNQLPNTWEVGFVGDFCDEIQPGFACGTHSDKNIGVIHLRPMNINRQGKLDYSEIKYIPETQNEKRLITGAVLFNNTNSPELIGKTTWINDSANGLAFSNHMTSLIFSDCVDTKFAAIQLHFLWSSRYFLHRCVKHVNQASISSTDLGKSVPFIAPPLPEQHRIVAKIEELFSELDKGIENLKTAREQLKVYRQSVLKHAFEGKLTEKWRKEHADELESAEALLKRIKAERDKRYQQQLKKWQQATKTGKRIPKPAKPKELLPLSDEELSELPKLPEDWGWVKLGNNAFVTKLAGFEFTKYVKYKISEDIPVIRAQNVTKQGFVPGNFVYVEREVMEMLPRSRVYGGELLMVFVGSIGNVGIVPYGHEYFLGPNVAKIQPEKWMLNKFIMHFLVSSLGFFNVSSFTKATVQGSISMSNIRNIAIPFLSYNEQVEIVQQIESRFSLVEQLEQTIEDSLQKAESLRQSILKKAFNGKLVPQDPSDEPVSVLLHQGGKGQTQ